jgi:hypothetical protein
MSPDPFHGIHRGCKVIAKKQPGQGSGKMVDGKHCNTHNVDLCRCGSTWDHAIAEEDRINPMRLISQKLRSEMAADPYYQVCVRKDSTCQGRITWEHAFIYAGKQINEKWAIIPLCVYHHLREGLSKEENQRIALSRATPEDLARYPNYNWEKRRNYLSNWVVLKS